ncbi:stage V sporulation protein AC [Ructibacterium gallinarum]|uniref:Stage V sporulation protein AC n=1 Tax=Ructibacterium gallinarum TaxID=2779355 RepID=A0A9D5M0L0_9FIRM|nr:stage V sporulation protein AC [Ructibacterium gallinarum]MBE5039936.1 stage V sporulation protein AC [Ructibacterium gallinarum]
MQYNQQEYQKYLEKKSPNSPLLKNVLFAFVIGGAICTIGQAVTDFYQTIAGLEESTARTAASITMIFFGALLTGMDVYCKIGKYAGAGTLVPITGFANSIVSPAMEFKKEGLVLGLASKMFVIAGPVLVYGITASVGVGIIYYIIRFIGG